jgi:phage terminase large subunit GpA-like protein
VDVQGNRIAITVIAWGRGEESWRVYWGEIFGNPSDHDDPVWTELESFLFRPYRHACGAELFIEETSIDAGDGNTSDAVYWFCRKHRTRGVMAVRGVETGEIFRIPRSIDPGARPTKASKYGLQIFLVGTEKAKDLIIGFGEHGGRLRLSEKDDQGRVITGRGPGRMHWYRGIRGDWYGQVVSEVKAPMKNRPRNKLYWQVKQGVRNEGLDTEVYALHASRRMKVNLMTEAQWNAIEERIRQPDLVGQGRQEIPAAVSSTSGRGGDNAALTGQPAQHLVKPKAPVDPALAQLMGGSNAGGAREESTPTPY